MILALQMDGSVLARLESIYIIAFALSLAGTTGGLPSNQQCEGEKVSGEIQTASQICI